MEIDWFLTSYYPLLILVFGNFSNVLTLVIFCRSPFRRTNDRPTIHLMRAVAVFDTFMLYGWNLDHFLSPVFGFTLQSLNMPFCRFFSFFNYFSSQSSAWLRVLICVDRWLFVNYPGRTNFHRSKNVLKLIFILLSILVLFNFHFFIFSCSIRSNGSISVYSTSLQVYPLWDYINLVVYNCLPFVLMLYFNGTICYRLIKTNGNFQNQQRTITIVLTLITFLFFFMTTPATIAFAFFYDRDPILLKFFDAFLYSYHGISSILYFVTLAEYRREFFKLFSFDRVE